MQNTYAEREYAAQFSTEKPAYCIRIQWHKNVYIIKNTSYTAFSTMTANTAVMVSLPVLKAIHFKYRCKHWQYFLPTW